MKNQLQEIHNAISDMFDYNIDSYIKYKSNVEKALLIVKTIPPSQNLMLENWKAMVISELQKELDERLSEKFYQNSVDQQKADLKFSKTAVSMVIMNLIMYL